MRLEEVREHRTQGDVAPKDEAWREVVHADALRFFPELVSDLGGDPAALLRQARIDPESLGKRGAVVEYRAMVQLLATAAAELQRPDFGVRLAMRQSGTKVMGPIGVVMKNSATVGQALGYCKRHIHAYSLATRVRFAPDRARHKLFVGLELLLDRIVDDRQVIEHGLMLAHLNIMEITGGAARAREVAFRHQPLSAPAVYRAAFGCEVRFGAPADGVVFTEADLLCPIVDPDERVYEMATSFIDARFPHATPPMHARVRSLVARRLGTEDCTNERIAAELCLHPRTLQRRLRAEGRSFETIKDEVRRDAALRYLRQADMPLTHVAEKLGYAEASVLSRSCYRWFAASPRQLRRQSTADAAAAGS
jgi:AraC-like DNA-binding protein